MFLKPNPVNLCLPNVETEKATDEKKKVEGELLPTLVSLYHTAPTLINTLSVTDPPCPHP